MKQVSVQHCMLYHAGVAEKNEKILIFFTSKLESAK